VLAQLPKQFFEPRIIATLREQFESLAPIHTWAPLRAFGRIFLVYYDDDAAEIAKASCDGISIEATASTPQFILRVFRGDPTPINVSDIDRYLRPPAIEKNFLISPPGSPPVGWEQIKEDPPNVTPLADDLIAALRKLQLTQRSAVAGPELVLNPEDGVGISVYVEDCDRVRDVDEDWDYGSDNPTRMQWRPVPTALPPMMQA